MTPPAITCRPKSHWILPVALALAACSSGPDLGPVVAQRQQRINDGLPEPGEPAVMLLYHQYYGVMCTGTLIGHRVVLTAKHCVQNDNGQLFPTAGWEVGVGPNMYQISHTYGVVDVRKTNGFNIENSDVAVLILNQDAQETPYQYQFELPSTIINHDALLIGYGQDHCPSGDSGTKLRTVDTILGWYSTNDYVTEGRGANSGDSGGPVFDPDTMQVMGVISRGSGDTCDGYTVVAAIQPWRAFLNQALEDTGDCAPTSLEETCNDNLDNDCNGVVDDGCASVGTPCTDDMECSSRFCRDVGTGGAICTEQCNPSNTSAQCDPGAVCLFITCGEGACAPGAAGALEVGDACTAHTDCSTLLCADPGTGTPVCMAHCNVDLGQCLATEACVALQSGESCGGCVPDSMATAPFHLGERCEANSDCVSGLCLDDGGLSYCSFGCDAENPCEPGFHCRESRCVRGYLGQVADPCLSDEDCSTELACLGANPAEQSPGYCTSACGGGEGCPSGTTCDGIACVPDGLAIGRACTGSTQCFSLGCFAFGGENSCTLTCDRREPCPPVSACVISDNGMTLCQPHGEPLVEGPPDDDDPKPKKDCSTGGSSDGAALLLLLTALLLFRRRKSEL